MVLPFPIAPSRAGKPTLLSWTERTDCDRLNAETDVGMQSVKPDIKRLQNAKSIIALLLIKKKKRKVFVLENMVIFHQKKLAW